MHNREFYAVLVWFAELLHEPEAVCAYTLKEGDTVLLDSWHVLHTCTAFNGIAHEHRVQRTTAQGK
ncbi:hypothetical protein PHLGIDRAFT_20134 [Phlebiopsis gigantea 11061_1 CR5-6]|uniref:TauD/TfdA-like domain-containing protein n=1 Tax=Phlebiopsis gigantea (strain 11061_1 CR5-6) TaxID=745531 RepID=A0A0C3NGK5_PHLG1|nr:hypothetical protein PHLGIDRAFT_20134 [Phlebiopsis gigantea 11061_1 CR5-6]